MKPNIKEAELFTESIRNSKNILMYYSERKKNKETLGKIVKVMLEKAISKQIPVPNVRKERNSCPITQSLSKYEV